MISQDLQNQPPFLIQQVSLIDSGVVSGLGTQLSNNWIFFRDF